MSALLKMWEGLTGTVLPYALSTPPAGWLECDGSAISRESYSGLFELLVTDSTGTRSGYVTLSIDASEVARTADETRMINIATLFCIRYQ